MDYPDAKKLFHGSRFDVLSIEVPNPKGGHYIRELIDLPGAAVILPLLDDDKIILIRNQRDVVQQTLWELPAGIVEPGEAPETCAARELEEETGYQSAKLSHLFDAYYTPGVSNEKFYFYLAQDLTFVGQKLEEDELILVETIQLTQALQMIKEGIICDAKTIAALLHFVSFQKS